MLIGRKESEGGLLLLGMLLLLLGGCGFLLPAVESGESGNPAWTKDCSSLSTEEISAVIEDALYEKYGVHFQVGKKVYRKGAHGLEAGSFFAEVTDPENGGVFHVEMLKCTKSVIKDDYPRVFYDSAIRALVEKQLAKQSKGKCIRQENYEVRYDFSEERWSREDGLADYLQNSKTYIYIKGDIADVDIDQAVDAVYELVKLMEEESLNYSLFMTYNGRGRAVARYHGSPHEMTRERILRKLSIKNK